MVLVFYPVACGYGRNSFNVYNTDKKEDCISIYKTLQNVDGVRVYDMGTDSRNTRATMSRAEFVEDYNDELMDGGYWCISLNAINDEDLVKLAE